MRAGLHVRSKFVTGRIDNAFHVHDVIHLRVEGLDLLERYLKHIVVLLYCALYLRGDSFPRLDRSSQLANMHCFRFD